MENFIEKAVKNMLRTEQSTTYKNIGPRMLHAIMGIADESGELTNIMLQATYYNKPVDIPHYKDELGDLLWYFCLAIEDIARTENKTPEEVANEILSINQAKLKVRYPDKYSNENALHRDLKTEQDAVDSAAKT